MSNIQTSNNTALSSLCKEIDCATYSVEDNKLRLYYNGWLDEADYKKVSDAGFIYAPKQELFVAVWTPERCDLAFAMAGDIGLDELSMADRAEAKIARLEGYQENRLKDADAFARAAASYASAQPVLIGHYSQRKAERDQQRHKNAVKASDDALATASYWQDRAKGVAHNVNIKNSARTRAKRIDRLYADLRSHQRNLNDIKVRLEIFSNLLNEQDHENFASRVKIMLGYGFTKMSSLYGQLRDNNITAVEACEKAVADAQHRLDSTRQRDWLLHILNRLSYEHEQFPAVPQFGGELKNTLIQTFFRKHGTEKVKASRSTELENAWLIKSPFDLPLHLTNGEETKQITLEDAAIVKLMQDVYYYPPIKKSTPAQNPLLNFKCESIEAVGGRGTERYRQIEMTKAEYKALHPEDKFTLKSACGTFRMKGTFERDTNKAWYMRDRVAVFLTDSKAHPAPESMAEQPAEAAA